MNFDDVPHGNECYISTEQRLLDHRWLVANLMVQSWTQCWTHERLQDAVANSLCFGVYQHGTTVRGEVPKVDRMVGFARVVTDGATYSLLVDVVIDPAFRGKGLGKFLVQAVNNHQRVRQTVVLLRTNTATELYEKCGFEVVSAMRRIPASNDAHPTK